MRSVRTARSGGTAEAGDDDGTDRAVRPALPAPPDTGSSRGAPAGADEGGAEALREGLRALARRTDDMAARTPHRLR